MHYTGQFAAIDGVPGGALQRKQQATYGSLSQQALGKPGNAPNQTNSLRWPMKENSLPMAQQFVPNLANRQSARTGNLVCVVCPVSTKSKCMAHHHAASNLSGILIPPFSYPGTFFDASTIRNRHVRRT